MNKKNEEKVIYEVICEDGWCIMVEKKETSKQPVDEGLELWKKVGNNHL